MDRLRHTTLVPLARASAFDLFTRGFGNWWPPTYSWSGLERFAERASAYGNTA